MNVIHKAALDQAIISLLLAGAVSLAYLMIHDEKEWWKKLGVSMHGFVMIASFIYALKASLYTMANPKYFAHLVDYYYIFIGVFILGTIWAVIKFQGPKWIHILVLPNIVFAYWIADISLRLLRTH